MKYTFLEAGIQCKSVPDDDYRAFVYYVESVVYPYHTQNDVHEIRGYGKSPVEALTDAMDKYKDLE